MDPQWTIYLYDGLTYLRVLADPTSRPRRKQMMPPNHREPEPPASPSTRQSAAILTITSWKADLAAAAAGVTANVNSFQEAMYRADERSLLLKVGRKVSRRLSRDIYKVIWLAVSHTVLHVGTFSHFFNTGFCEGEEISEGRELIWDAVGSLVAAA